MVRGFAHAAGFAVARRCLRFLVCRRIHSHFCVLDVAFEYEFISVSVRAYSKDLLIIHTCRAPLLEPIIMGV